MIAENHHEIKMEANYSHCNHLKVQYCDEMDAYLDIMTRKK